MTDYGIVFDTETTGLPLKGSAPVEKQPHIIEFAGIKFNWETLEEVDRIDFFIKPPNPITAEITRITGITDKDLKDAKPFPAYYDKLMEFHLGVKHWVAHNLTFDRNMMIFDLKRMQKHMAFPYPPTQHCTVQASYGINNFRLNLTKLHAHYFSEDENHQNDEGEYAGFDAHRAMNDVEALFDCVKALRKDELI